VRAGSDSKLYWTAYSSRDAADRSLPAGQLVILLADLTNDMPHYPPTNRQIKLTIVSGVVVVAVVWQRNVFGLGCRTLTTLSLA
jgi:hypothetical protein